MEFLLMTDAHVAQIAAIEKACFSLPWSEKSISAELVNPLSLWLVAVENGQVVGYVGSQSVMGDADMMNLAVRKDYRRQGIGRQLVVALIEQLKIREVYCLTLEVRASNQSAVALYLDLGFEQVGRRPNYYSFPKEDALIFRKEWYS